MGVVQGETTWFGLMKDWAALRVINKTIKFIVKSSCTGTLQIR